MYNLITYSIYLILTGTIIVHVGWVCYTNGERYIVQLVPNDIAMGLRINKMLLIGYYLLNIGYAIFAISNWNLMSTLIQMIEAITIHTAFILFLLAGLHYFNLFWITTFIKKLL